MKTKIAIIHDGISSDELKKVGKVLVEAAKQVGLDPKLLKENKDLFVIENITGLEWSKILTEDQIKKEKGGILEYSRLIIIGLSTYKKIIVNNLDDYINQTIPQPRSWTSQNEKEVLEKITKLLEGWSPFSDAKRNLVLNKTSSKEFKIDLESINKIKSYLTTELSTHNYKVCVLNTTINDPVFIIQDDAGNIVNDEETPFIVNDDIIKDEKEVNLIKEKLIQSGLKKPYPFSLQDMIGLLEVIASK